LKAIVHIIDDDDSVRDSMCALLESCGYEVRDHATAEAFLSHSEKGTGCLLTDHDMPGITGIELLEHLRATDDQTPALIITGGTDPTIRTRANRIGVRVLQKPVAEEELVRLIEQLRSK
jgi:FixJ family two-component response regulator